MLCPITFSIPKIKIGGGEAKTKLLSDLIPGNLSTYIYNTEEEYYNEYKQSYFAVTTKKDGWDCMRHYEIIANGCIPYFIDIEQCPPNTLFLLPKDLLLQGNALYHKFQSTNINEEEYAALQQKFLDYARAHLTTERMAQYILQTTGFTNASKILFLSGNTNPDYLRCVTLHGFKEVMGSNCHDYPKVPHIYKSESIDYASLYGKGMTYTNLLEPELHKDSLDESILADIKNKYYDLVIYGSYHRGMPHYDLVCQVYAPNEIILLCGEDIHHCNCDAYLKKGHSLFVREL